MAGRDAELALACDEATASYVDSLAAGGGGGGAAGGWLAMKPTVLGVIRELQARHGCERAAVLRGVRSGDAEREGSGWDAGTGDVQHATCTMVVSTHTCCRRLPRAAAAPNAGGHVVCCFL
jgi:hypothetical protein